MVTKPPLPPFTLKTAQVKVQWHDEYRSCGNENWEFADNGLMMRRFASINDLPIQESERKFRWERT
jgi:uncharacterized protein